MKLKSVTLKKTKLGLIIVFLVIGAVALSSQWPRLALGGIFAMYGDPLPDLTGEELAQFRDAKIDFEEIKEPADGLGPLFNGRSCAECHSTPATGGSSSMTVVRFGRLDASQFDGLAERGGSLLQLFATTPLCQERLPREANILARRLTPPLFGAGLIENIPDAALITNAASQPTGQRGRVHMVMDTATKQMLVGRFGWKAQQATLLAFSADAYVNEMGITSRLEPEERAPNGDRERLAECDRVADPEDRFDPRTQLFSIDKFALFMRFLGPPPRAPQTEEVLQGERLFATIGCSVCHTPEFQTGSHESAALNRRSVKAFSDFLLHDVGTVDNITQGEATGNEFRTPPLWGLHGRGPFMHSGSAATIEQAIGMHGRQALSSRLLFGLLSQSQKQALIAFLNSL